MGGVSRDCTWHAETIERGADEDLLASGSHLLFGYPGDSDSAMRWDTFIKRDGPAANSPLPWSWLPSEIDPLIVVIRPSTMGRGRLYLDSGQHQGRLAPRKRPAAYALLLLLLVVVVVVVVV